MQDRRPVPARLPRATAGTAAAFAVVLTLVLASCGTGPGPGPSGSPSVTTPPPSVTAEPSPTGPTPTGPTPTAPVVYSGPVATNPAQAVAYAHAWGVGDGRFDRTAVVLLDRITGALFTAGDIDVHYRTASLVKAFIAARMLVEQQPFDAATQDLMWRMITCSDDGAATTLWQRTGGSALIGWVVDRYQLGDGVVPPPAERPNSWGLTGVSARGLATFYDRVALDSVVGPWLRDAMGHATPNGCDDYYQHFGLPEAASTWAVKQGWIHNHEGHAYLHSTGYIDGDRYIAVLLTEGPSGLYEGTGAGTGRYVVTGMAQALLPGGHVPGVA